MFETFTTTHSKESFGINTSPVVHTPSDEGALLVIRRFGYSLLFITIVRLIPQSRNWETNSCFCTAGSLSFLVRAAHSSPNESYIIFTQCFVQQHLIGQRMPCNGRNEVQQEGSINLITPALLLRLFVDGKD